MTSGHFRGYLTASLREVVTGERNRPRYTQNRGSYSGVGFRRAEVACASGGFRLKQAKVHAKQRELFGRRFLMDSLQYFWRPSPTLVYSVSVKSGPRETPQSPGRLLYVGFCKDRHSSTRGMKTGGRSLQGTANGEHAGTRLHVG